MIVAAGKYSCQGVKLSLREKGRILGPFRTVAPRNEDYRRRDPWKEPEIPGNGWRDRVPSALPVSSSGLILLACIVVFFLSLVFPGFVYNFLALNPDYVMQKPWTILTYMFVHANFNHLFWNMIVLFFFGMDLERRAGEKNSCRSTSSPALLLRWAR
jgi:hypothetical protein